MAGRYDRQLALPQIGPEGQRRLAASRVLVVGVGGLGLPAAAWLAGAGVGQITLVDHDRVELSNLHRQVLFTEADLGSPKVVACARHLRALNPEVRVVERPERLAPGNVRALVAAHDLVLDCADNFAATYLLSDHCRALGRPLVAASIAGSHGHLGVFCGGAPSFRALFPLPPADAPDCAGAGVLGPAVGALGLLMAQEAIKLAVDPAASLAGRLLVVDLWHTRTSLLDFRAAPEPEPAETVAILGTPELTPEDVLVDVRSPPERAADPVPGAVIAAPRQAARAVFFCATGRRALAAAVRALAETPGRPVGVWLRQPGEAPAPLASPGACG